MATNPTSAVIVVHDPDDTPISVFVDKDGTVEWRCDSTDYPTFEIEFEGDSPAAPTDVLVGGPDSPVVVHMTEEGKYKYRIHHTHKDGCTRQITGVFKVRSCKVC